MIYEIYASSFESAGNAQIAGATHIELCSELDIGGITPSYGFIKRVIDELNISNYILIRPRSGGFTHIEEELDVMLRNIALRRELGCQGVITDVLHRDNTIDEVRIAQLTGAAGTMEFIYRRAFDRAPDPIAAIHTLKGLGVHRISTSGGKKLAVGEFDLLEELSRIGDKQPAIMPGGGINAKSVEQIKVAGFTDIHFSGTVFGKLGTTLPFLFKAESFLDESKRPIFNVEIMRGIIGPLTNSPTLLTFN